MRSASLTRSLGAGIAAVALALTGLAIGAAPAQAADEPGITVTPDTFPSGDWGTGMTIEGHGAAPNEDVSIRLGTQHSLAEVGPIVTADENGEFTTNWTPTVYASSADDVTYTVSASQKATGDEDPFYASQELTITDGTSADFPENTSPAKLKDPGITGSFSGFDPGETVTATLWVFDGNGNDLVELPSTSDQATADENGDGTLSVHSDDEAPVNATSVQVRLTGETSGKIASAFVRLPSTTLGVENQTFPAGNWLDGLHFSGTSTHQGDVQLTLEVRDETTGDVVDSETDPETVTVDADGNFSGTWTPTMVTEDDINLSYRLVATQELENGDALEFPVVYLYIESSAYVTFPAKVTPEQLQAGITGEFSGYAPNDTVNAVIWTLVDGEYSEVESTSKTVTSDADGSGTITIASTALLKPGTELMIGAYDTQGAEYFSNVTVIASPAETPGGTDDPSTGAGDGDDTAPAGSVDEVELAATGSETMAPLALTAVLLLGGAVLLLVRRKAHTQR